MGLPYPDRSDPELAARMAFLDKQAPQQAPQQAPRQAHGVQHGVQHAVQGSGQAYYEALCMRVRLPVFPRARVPLFPRADSCAASDSRP